VGEYIPNQTQSVWIRGHSLWTLWGMIYPTQKCDVQQLFGNNMRRIRRAQCMTQEQVAEAAELHPNYISSVERGERNISIRNIERIAKALGVTMAELVSASGEQASD
jgi:ribosome-binding protein aMBF1 (putative translation factor)